MRSEYNQEIVRRVSCYSPEQTRHWDLVYVGPYHEINDDQEGQRVCGVIKTGVFRTRKDKGNFVPYTSDVTVNPISQDLCRMKTHTLNGSSGIGGTCCAEVLK